MAISGDTIDTPGLRALAAGADVLVSDVMNKSIVDETECAFGRIPDPGLERIFRDIRTYHIDLPELAELANDAGVATLVMTHLVPAVDFSATQQGLRRIRRVYSIFLAPHGPPFCAVPGK